MLNLSTVPSHETKLCSESGRRKAGTTVASVHPSFPNRTVSCSAAASAISWAANHAPPPKRPHQTQRSPSPRTLRPGGAPPATRGECGGKRPGPMGSTLWARVAEVWNLTEARAVFHTPGTPHDSPIAKAERARCNASVGCRALARLPHPDRDGTAQSHTTLPRKVGCGEHAVAIY